MPSWGDCERPELAHAALDCLLLTSAWEGFPNAVLEAMASARPVVCVDIPAVREIVEDASTGLLVGDNPATLAGAVLDLFNDPERAEELGRAARRRVVRLYSLERMVEAYRQLYSRVARGPARSPRLTGDREAG